MINEGVLVRGGPQRLGAAQKNISRDHRKGALPEMQERTRAAPGFVRRVFRSKFNLEDVDPTKC
jgi:hypothetical protein